MRPRPNPLILLTLAAPLVLLAPSAHAGAPTPTEAHLADVDIVDTALPKNAQTTRFTLAVEESGPAASVQLPIDGFHYKIVVRCSALSAGRLPTSLEVRRSDMHAGAPLGLTASTDVALLLAHKKTVFSVQRPDGTRAEITLTVR